MSRVRVPFPALLQSTQVDFSLIAKVCNPPWRANPTGVCEKVKGEKKGAVAKWFKAKVCNPPWRANPTGVCEKVKGEKKGAVAKWFKAKVCNPPWRANPTGVCEKVKGGKKGAVAKWFKAKVCKTFIRRFESDRRLNKLVMCYGLFCL